MKRTALLAAAMGLCASAVAAAPASYRLIPEQSWITAEVLHFGTSTIRARFGPLEGQVMLDAAAGRGEVGLEIDTARVDTGFKVFDARLRQGDLLASDEFPKAWFVASRFTFEGAALREVRGELTLRGVSRALGLHALRFACRDDPGGEICGGDFEGFVRRSEFGASFGVPLIGDDVRLVVSVEARRDIGMSR